jgi:hypothetical protein
MPIKLSTVQKYVYHINYINQSPILEYYYIVVIVYVHFQLFKINIWE